MIDVRKCSDQRNATQKTSEGDNIWISCRMADKKAVLLRVTLLYHWGFSCFVQKAATLSADTSSMPYLERLYEFSSPFEDHPYTEHTKIILKW